MLHPFTQDRRLDQRRQAISLQEQQKQQKQQESFIANAYSQLELNEIEPLKSQQS